MNLQVRITGPRQAGPLSPLDPRDHAWRPDLADIALADRVAVPSYAQPVILQAQSRAPLLSAPGADATAVSEILPGEEFALLDESHGFGWGYALADGYVGHVRRDVLALANGPATALVGPGDALIFAAADLKSPVLAALPAGSRLVTGKREGDYIVIAGGVAAGGFVHHRHILPADAAGRPHWLDIARLFTGAPYRWGGRSRQGIDCSGLVQLARQLAGHHCRRDSDMICADAEAAGMEIRAGDIACWPGHVGIMLDAATILHANAHWMRVVAEPLADVVARQQAEGKVAEPQFRRFAEG